MPRVRGPRVAMFPRNLRPGQLFPVAKVEFLQLRRQGQGTAVSLGERFGKLYTALQGTGVDPVELWERRQRCLNIPLGGFCQSNVGASVTDAAGDGRRCVADQIEFHDANTAR